MYKIKLPEELKKNKKYDYINLYSCFIDLQEKFNNLESQIKSNESKINEQQIIIKKINRENTNLKQINIDIKKNNNELIDALNKINIITQEKLKNDIIDKIQNTDILS